MASSERFSTANEIEGITKRSLRIDGLRRFSAYPMQDDRLHLPQYHHKASRPRRFSSFGWRGPAAICIDLGPLFAFQIALMLCSGGQTTDDEQSLCHRLYGASNCP